VHDELKKHNDLQKQAFCILYLLLFILLGYDKSFYDYSSHGYPLKEMADIKT
jgi:hypothetical protein